MQAASKSLEARNQAAEIKVRAERQAGELISKMEKAKTGPKVNSQPAKKSKAEQLDEVGIKKDQASRLEQMAAVPEEAFEELANAEAATAAGREITSTAARLTR